MSLESPTPSELGRWRLLDVEHTAVFSDGLDPDPSVVSQIRAFDPHYVPLLVRRVVQAPTGGVAIFGYHVIGRHIPTWGPGEVPDEPVHLASIPSGWPYRTGTVYPIRTWSLGYQKGSWQYRCGYPEIFLPHDMELCRWMNATYRQATGEADGIKRQIKARLRAWAEEEEKKIEAAEAAAKDRLHDDASELKDAVQNELHWMEHPRQRPDDRPAPKAYSLPPLPLPSLLSLEHPYLKPAPEGSKTGMTDDLLKETP